MAAFDRLAGLGHGSMGKAIIDGGDDMMKIIWQCSQCKAEHERLFCNEQLGVTYSLPHWSVLTDDIDQWWFCSRECLRKWLTPKEETQ